VVRDGAFAAAFENAATERKDQVAVLWGYVFRKPIVAQDFGAGEVRFTQANGQES
jgi:hypothetical protein